MVRPVPYENMAGGQREEAGEPPYPLAVGHTWRSDLGGYVFRIGYFTEGQVEDRRWEAARLRMMDSGRFCNGFGEGRIVRREVRWYEPTPVSRRRCAALVYTLHCTHPRQRPGDDLARQRILLLREDAEPPIEADCGEKDRARRPPPGPYRYNPPLQELLSPEAGCALTHARGGRPFRVTPETRIFTRTRIHPAFATHVGAHDGFGYRIPAWGIDHAFSEASRIPPRLRETAVPNDGVNILVEQDFALDDTGAPYCVRLTARQGGRVWQRRLVRAGLVEHLARVVGKDRHGVSRDSSRYWAPTSDATLLAMALGSYLVAHAAPDSAFRRPWR